MVVPFNECIAHPGKDRYLLTEHLLAVGRATGKSEGNCSDKLAFLAGLLHDIGKAQSRWQVEIKREPPGNLPPHAPIGSAIYMLLAITLVEKWSTEDKRKRDLLTTEVIDWMRIIHRHHGALPDLKEETVLWDAVLGFTDALSAILQDLDIDGLFNFVSTHIPEIEPVKTMEILSGIEKIADSSSWRRLCQRYRKAIDRTIQSATSTQNCESEITDAFAVRAANLVVGDRYHAGFFEKVVLTPERSELGLACLESYCKRAVTESVDKRSDHNLIDLRSRFQQHAVETFSNNPDAIFYSLQLPTGSGKTLTALRTALESCRQGLTQRIIYVAPYISILSQATDELTKASGMEVLQHHHLSVVNLDDEKQVDISESWQAEIITTTFNQLFRVLFPARAQDCLKRRAIHHAFVIVDEVQIVAPAYWNLFLRRLESVARTEKMKVLLTTATLPSMKRGGCSKPISLSGKASSLGRYKIVCDAGEMNAWHVACSALERTNNIGSTAIVLNTVRDAYDVYEAVISVNENVDVFLLTGAMLPGHKASIIADVAEILSDYHTGKRNRPVVVVCTQILEAGVDLDFSSIMRARSILPSIAQTAGRANRHGSRARAEVSVFDYVREDGRSTRAFVYRDPVSRSLTDEVFVQNPCFNEEQLPELLTQYYWEYSTCMPGTEAMRRIEDAAFGSWSALAEVEPFEQSMPGVEVFIPIQYSSFQRKKSLKKLITKFAPEGAEQVFERYFDTEYKKSLSFTERKQLSALFNLHTVTVPKRVAEKISIPVFPDCPESICRLNKFDFYCDKAGVAHWYGNNEPFFMV